MSTHFVIARFHNQSPTSKPSQCPVQALLEYHPSFSNLLSYFGDKIFLNLVRVLSIDVKFLLTIVRDWLLLLAALRILRLVVVGTPFNSETSKFFFAFSKYLVGGNFSEELGKRKIVAWDSECRLTMWNRFRTHWPGCYGSSMFFLLQRVSRVSSFLLTCVLHSRI